MKSFGSFATFYERNGTASIFMFCEPLAGRRTVSVKEQRTMIDWAHQVKHLLDVESPDADSRDFGMRQPQHPQTGISL